MISSELAAKIASWRQKAVEGTLTEEEMKEAIVLLREGRAAALASSATAKRTRAVAAIPKADDLLDEIGRL